MPDTNGHQDVDPEEAVNTKPLTVCWPSVNTDGQFVMGLRDGHGLSSPVSRCFS